MIVTWRRPLALCTVLAACGGGVGPHRAERVRRVVAPRAHQDEYADDGGEPEDDDKGVVDLSCADLVDRRLQRSLDEIRIGRRDAGVGLDLFGHGS